MKHNRILVFSTDDHLYPAGGAEQAFGNISERLPHIEFDLICARLRKNVPAFEIVKNVHIHRLGFGIPKIDGFILALFGHRFAYRLMKKNTYDCMWSIMASYGAFSAVRVRKKTGLPFILTLQEGDTFEYIYHRVRFVRKQFDAIFTHADAVQAISVYLLNWAKEMGFAGSTGKVIPNGVNVTAFTKSYSSEELADTRATFGFPSDAFVLCTSSRLEIKNGIEVVIDALKLMPANVCFLICGSGSLDEKIEAQIRALGLSERVTCMGFVEPKQLPRIMHACDAFVRPSRSEGLGNAFLEAMACGLPVIATQVGGIADFLFDAKRNPEKETTGWAVDVDTPSHIAHAVDDIMKNPDHVRNVTKCAREMVEHEYNWDLVARKIETEILEPLSQK